MGIGDWAIKQNFSKSLSNYENEITQLTKENLNLMKKISEMEAQINALLAKNENLEKIYKFTN